MEAAIFSETLVTSHPPTRDHITEGSRSNLLGKTIGTLKPRNLFGVYVEWVNLSETFPFKRQIRLALHLCILRAIVRGNGIFGPVLRFCEASHKKMAKEVRTQASTFKSS
jgi:hypothetical protein